ncbi:hypothetical protein DFH29DRAFT_936008 [Suillus ampliporus]|nr:hypothetical protein DFH29DRAFT_936008 [Suillus ampliporus]
MLASCLHKRGLPRLTLDIASICAYSLHCRAKPGDLPSLADAYLDNTNDDQYKLNPLWSENISDSLPPELQRLQLTSPVRTPHFQNNQIDLALLSGEETDTEREYCSREGSPMSPYSPLYSSVSSSVGLSFPLTPAWASSETDSAPSRSRFGSMSTHLSYATSSELMPDSELHSPTLSSPRGSTPDCAIHWSLTYTSREDGEADEELRGF